MNVDATAPVAAMSCIMSVNSGSQLTTADATPAPATLSLTWAWTCSTTFMVYAAGMNEYSLRPLRRFFTIKVAVESSG